MTKDNVKGLEAELEALKAEYEEAKAAVPPHSVKPDQILRLEELEEAIEEIKERIGKLEAS